MRETEFTRGIYGGLLRFGEGATGRANQGNHDVGSGLLLVEDWPASSRGLPPLSEESRLCS